MDQSIFVQRSKELDLYSAEIYAYKDNRFNYIHEYRSTTLAEADNADHHKSYRKDKVLISKFVPAISYKKETIDVRGHLVNGFEIEIGDTNKVFNPRR